MLSNTMCHTPLAVAKHNDNRVNTPNLYFHRLKKSHAFCQSVKIKCLARCHASFAMKLCQSPTGERLLR